MAIISTRSPSLTRPTRRASSKQIPTDADYLTSRVSIHLDKDSDTAVVKVGDEAVLLQQGEWSEWVQVPFDALPYGMMPLQGAVRFYAMGERGRLNEDATADDMTEMGRIVAEAIDAGAVGFSTSRTIGHRSLWGEPVPGTFAADDELLAIGEAMAERIESEDMLLREISDNLESPSKFL